LCVYAAQCAYAAFFRVLLIDAVSTTRETAETPTTAVNAHKRCRAGRSLPTVGATMVTAAHMETAPHEQGAGDGPLAGVRVLDLGTVYAAPISAMLLGDYGADVLKIEHPRGDPARTHGPSKDGHGLWWKVIARNKRTATLVLSRPEGREIMQRLVADADVLIENFRPGVMEKWGLGPEHLLEVNPGLVMLRVTGFGQTGPYAERRAFGTLAEAMSGLAHQTGQADGPPTLPPFGLADGVAAISGAYAVMLALYHRDANGAGGQVIDLSLLAPLLGILGPGPSAYDQLGSVPGRHGNRSPNNAPRNAYETRDGRWVAISASATSVAERVMAVVGRPDIAEQEWFASARERVRHADQLDGVVGDWIAGRDFDAVMAAFEDAGAAIAPIYDMQQLVDDPHVRATGMITSVDDEHLGPLRMQNLVFGLLGSPGRIRFPGRGLGQDTEEVFAERLGLDSERIAQLREDGVI
jgi:crotonobetainyl-CoA:carnitine CoA-transferase CaiB-like acyl-CoA transferase